LQLNGEAVRILVEVGIVEANNFPGRFLALRNQSRKRARTLGDETGIRSIKQYGGLAWTRRLEKVLSLMSLDGDHEALPL
jgi:hypothetical protein